MAEGGAEALVHSLDRDLEGRKHGVAEVEVEESETVWAGVARLRVDAAISWLRESRGVPSAGGSARGSAAGKRRSNAAESWNS